MKPFLSENCTYASKISLVHNDNAISDDQELADTFNNFLNTLQIIWEKNITVTIISI